MRRGRDIAVLVYNSTIKEKPVCLPGAAKAGHSNVKAVDYAVVRRRIETHRDGGLRTERQHGHGRLRLFHASFARIKMVS